MTAAAMQRRISDYDITLVDGVCYSVDRNGVIHQQPPYEKFVYDVKYVEDRYVGIPDKVAVISHLRAGLLLGATCPSSGKAVLDVGYGTGDFLKVISECGLRACGIDVTGYPLPDGCNLISERELLYSHWHAVTFFDSVEHMVPHFLSIVNADYVMITAPFCHEPPWTEWFRNWKHRRPHEHLYHYNPDSLNRMMRTIGYEEVWHGSPEDVIRKPDGPRANTFTSVFNRRQ